MTHELRIPFEDGDLAVTVWGPADAPPVLAVHGITASSRAWAALSRHLPEVRLLAPDLRGRGRSRDLPVSTGLRHHAADLLRVMLEAPFRLARRALPHMYARGWGRVINISSVHGLRASPFKAAYVAAKHGMEGLSKVTALEGAPHGVTSNCVNPGYVRTPLVEKQIADQARVHGIPETDVVEKVLLTESAIKRLLEPAEVADLVAWLCGPSAGMVTGSSYVMDGGWTAR